jgi:hypothetical protein
MKRLAKRMIGLLNQPAPFDFLIECLEELHRS